MGLRDINYLNGNQCLKSTECEICTIAMVCVISLMKYYKVLSFKYLYLVKEWTILHYNLTNNKPFFVM